MTASADRATFIAAFEARVRDEILDRCAACGRCAEVCPVVAPTGLADASAPELTRGVLDLVRGGTGTAGARLWAEACAGDGACIPACPHGVNPRFMLDVAHARAKGGADAEEAQRRAARVFSTLTRGIRALSHIQLPPAVLARVNPKPRRPGGASEAPPEIVFYTGCNVLRTPHIALICLDLLDRLGTAYEVMGGPSHCCGVFHQREGDARAATGMATNTIGRLAAPGAGAVVSWCPSCQTQFGDNHLPTYERATGAKPFDFRPFFLWLAERADRLAPLLTRRVEKRVAIDERPPHDGVVDAVRRLLRMVPGVEVVELPVRMVGTMTNSLRASPELKRELREATLREAGRAGVTTFATVYHACHREFVAYQPQVSFEIVNVMEIFAESAGIAHQDLFKRFQMVRDVDRLLAEQAATLAGHDLPLDQLRAAALAELLAHAPEPIRA